ncbi:MAG: hypothetical protein FJ290_15475 [Planctomycetes bacterium]|nr:hypothetical protein [Planctomycetota bacterium]
MRVTRHALSTLALAALATGCAAIRRSGAPEQSLDRKGYLEELRAEAAAAKAEFNQTRSKEARNRYIAAQLAMHDIRYLQFVRDMATSRQVFDTATEIATMALNLTGTVTGGVQTKRVLAAMSAGFTGAKASIDKNIFFGRFRVLCG